MFNKKIFKNLTYRQASKRFDRITRRFQPVWRQHQLKLVTLLIAVFLLTVTAAQFTKAQPAPEPIEVSVRQVETLRIQTNQTSQTVPATIKNLNSVTLVAQSAGPVKSIAHREGDYVYQGNLIASQASSYAGGNSAVVTRDIAAKNLELARLSLENTVEVVSKNRELADLNRNNTEELRQITEESIGATENLIDLLNQQISEVETNLDAAASPAEEQQFRATLISLKSSLNQVESGLRNTRYQVDTDSPLNKLAQVNKDLVYETTELQLKSAEISHDIAALNYQQAQISASLTQVVAPIAGTIERIYVEPGTYVTPGTPVAKIVGQPRLCVIATISGSLATQVNLQQPLSFVIEDQTYSQPINHVTSTPTSGNLYEVLTTLPDWFSSVIYENQTIEIELPLIASAQTEAVFIPVDAVFVTNTSRFVYVIEDNQAVRRSVDTGDIIGSNIEIKSGLMSTDEIILDRSVNENELVERITI